MKKLKIASMKHERVDGVDKAYAVLQKNYLLEEMKQKEVNGSFLYDSLLNWIGCEFLYENEIYEIIFDDAVLPFGREDGVFVLDINEKGVYGVETINGIINGISNEHPFLKVQNT
jgi:hypothetical protein